MGIKDKPNIIGQLLIDLTPLLDVIFILLIVVLTYQGDFDKAADEKLATAEKIEQEAEAIKKQVEQDALDAISKAEDMRYAACEQLDTYVHIYDSVNVVTIYASYTPSNRKYRTVYIQIGAGDLWEKEINPSNEDMVWAECQSYIEKQLAGSNAVPTLFSIKNEKMLYRDEQSIIALYEKLNVEDKYLKNYMGTDDE